MKKTNKIIKLASALGIRDNNGTDKKAIKNLKKGSYKILRNIRKKSKEKRIEYLHGLAEKYAAQNKMSKQKAILELLSHEELRKM